MAGPLPSAIRAVAFAATLAIALRAVDDPLPGTRAELPVASPAAVFSPGLPPLRPDDHPHARHPVNRDRVYDYYAKEALRYMADANPPVLLPAYPGLDGGKQGHWGNQNDTVTWKDGRWGASDHGHLFSGVFRSGGLTLPKGVWVREGDDNGCFDPETLCFRARWKGRFLRLSDHRHGFNGAAEPAGAVTISAPGAKLGPGDVYHGYYRKGDQVVFSYAIAGQEYLETLSGGRKARQPGDIGAAWPTRWPGWITTVGKQGTGAPFAVDTLTLPTENPYGTLFFVSGFDFLPDGSVALCTMTGEVWLCRGIDAGLRNLRWKRFATGLHQPLGLKVVAGEILVLGRDQVTRLVDLNRDDEADYHECLTNAYATSAGAHDYVVGLDADPRRGLLTASGNQGVLRLQPPAGVEVLGTGLRNPNGIAVSPDGRFVVSQGQEGEWTPASALFQVDRSSPAPAPHFGYGGSRRDRANTPPLLQLPRGVDNSCGGGVFLPEGAWSDLRGSGNLIHLSYGAGCAFLVSREQVDGVWQGAATLITGAFDSGPQHARFNPRDDALYVSGMTGWGTYTPADGSLQRVRRVGNAPLPVGHEVRADGILLRFNQPIDATFVADPRHHFVQAWNYRYGPGYGSPEFSVAQPGVVGHDRWPVASVRVLESGRAVFLAIPALTPANQVHVHLGLAPGKFHDVFMTVHALGRPLLGSDVPHRHVPVAAPSAPSVELAVRPVRWETELCGLPARSLTLRAATGLQFEQKELRVAAGERIALRFENPDDMPHNWVLTRVGEADAVAALADGMVASPDAYARHYVPETPAVLCHSRLMLPHTATVLYFEAPASPGRYPYLCTFPGHSQIMRGVLVVEPSKAPR